MATPCLESSARMRASAREVLKHHFGYASFRAGQEEIIINTLSGKDSLVLMPTGGGKSLCYQIPALMRDGCAIVVSPLIALMNDQVLALKANGIPAAAINSNRDEALNRRDFDDAARGKLKIIYISPERLLTDIDILAQSIGVSLVAIDEAHCISQWGHDFRPVYTSLACVKEKFPHAPVMALTATADRLTRADISSALGLDNPFCWIGSFDRPNISLTVMSDPGKKQRLNIISALIRKHHLDSGIVYCLSRKKTEDMHKALSDLGFRSVCYHAGLSPQQRQEAQKAFVNGDAQVVCATIAFGMGIDKSNIRWVVHNNIPGNIESYYQEIGRAGRDGMPAEALLFYNYGDIMMRRNFVNESGQKDINSNKLDIMQRYAEAAVCRRRILLSYFSEEMTHDCGNCDNCRSPKRRFDGTVLAQKALSAVIRINGKEAINTVIDILRASNRADIIRKGYHLIKTYGAGRDLTSREWHSYILQMVQLGLFEVLYEDNFHIRPTAYGMRVVRGEEKVELSVYEEYNYKEGSRKRGVEKAPKPQLTPDQRLIETLKQLRLDISKKEGIAPYMVFSDATLAEMVEKRPLDVEDFSKISGVGSVKLARYGKTFILEIRKDSGLKKTMPAGYSQNETLIMIKSGMTPEAVAELRGLGLVTVYSHISKMIDEDKFTDFRRLLPEKTYRKIITTLEQHADDGYSRLQQGSEIENHLISLAIAERRWRERHGMKI